MIILDLLLTVVNNIMIVIGIAALGSFIDTKVSRYKSIIWGVLFGIGAILLTKECILLFPGRAVGFRYLLMTFAGFFGGISSILIAGSINGIYRWLQGGIGAPMGIISAFVFGFIGYYLRRFDILSWGIAKHIYLSCSLTTIMLLLTIATAPSISESFQVIQVAAIPLYSLAGIGTYVGFKLFSALQNTISNQQLLQEQYSLLRQTQQHFHKAFNVNPNIMMIISEHVYIDINESFLKATGLPREEIVGRSVKDLNLWYDLEEKRVCHAQFHKEGKIYNFKMQYHTTTGPRTALLTVDSLGDSPYFLCVITDIEDKLQHEENMARFDKLNLIGEMAASIGHEVRNPLTTVRGYLQMFQRKDKFVEYNEQFQTMIDEIDRANSIITEFLSLSKNQPIEMSYSNLNTIIHTLCPLIQADALWLGHDIQIITTNIPDIKLDPKEIRQLILNLTRNGLEAMKSRGRITIQTYVTEGKVILAIHDTGSGIPSEVRDKLGTPFVTTKESGTGLGLAICYRIAQRHNAVIDISTSTQGTTFFIKFPRGEIT